MLNKSKSLHACPMSNRNLTVLSITIDVCEKSSRSPFQHGGIRDT